MKKVKCFWLEPAGRIRRSLRRYVSSEKSQCTVGEYGFHNASVFLDEIVDTNPQGTIEADISVSPFEGDPRWPVKCEQCGYQFTNAGHFQIFTDRIYSRTDSGEEMTLRDAAPGAMWNATWMTDFPDWCGPDGIALTVKLPDGTDWHTDGRANNCDSPCVNCRAPYHQHRSGACKDYKDARPHKCWVREGEPTKPETLTVGKMGITCEAGAGSIQSPKYHGFLRNGFLEEC